MLPRNRAVLSRGSTRTVLKVIGAGDLTEHAPVNRDTNWECVEQHVDDDTKYVENDQASATMKDRFEIENPPRSATRKDYIYKVSLVWRGGANLTGTSALKAVLRFASDYEHAFSARTWLDTYEESWGGGEWNPELVVTQGQLAPWEWSVIDDLQVGITSVNDADWPGATASKLFLVVYSAYTRKITTYDL